jgi:DNA-directed RNA polymerase I, II, and III subunit RPABC1
MYNNESDDDNDMETEAYDTNNVIDDDDESASCDDEDEECDPMDYAPTEETDALLEEKVEALVVGKKTKKNPKKQPFVQSTFEYYLTLLSKQSVDGICERRNIKGMVMNTIKEIISVRKYKVVEDDRFSKLMAKHAHCEKMQIFIAAKLQNQARLLLIFYVDQKIGIQDARDMNHVIESINAKEVIIVNTDGVTPVARKLLMGIHTNIQFFNTSELVVNYTKHKLVPAQRKLSTTETTEFLKRYNLTKDMIGRISRVDPIVKFHGWPLGAVIQSTRVLGQAVEPYINYRVVRL